MARHTTVKTYFKPSIGKEVKKHDRNLEDAPERQRYEKPTEKEINQAIWWWEHDVNDKDMHKYIVEMFPIEKTWTGDAEYRHSKLLAIYRKYGTNKTSEKTSESKDEDKDIIKEYLREIRKLYPDVTTSDLQGRAGAMALDVMSLLRIPKKTTEGVPNFIKQHEIEEIFLEYAYGELDINSAKRFILDQRRK